MVGKCWGDGVDFCAGTYALGVHRRLIDGVRRVEAHWNSNYLVWELAVLTPMLCAIVVGIHRNWAHQTCVLQRDAVVGHA